MKKLMDWTAFYLIIMFLTFLQKLPDNLIIFIYSKWCLRKLKLLKTTSKIQNYLFICMLGDWKEKSSIGEKDTLLSFYIYIWQYSLYFFRAGYLQSK